ncbi:MAG TPA: hypothetical protein VFP80_03360 [Thermoanaerobaculia bacterium]|nr:hypothetical protein [Thermoanaerobaculia bacterium]
MHFPRIALLLACCLAAVPAAAQPLTCPPAPAGRPCEAFHYHVQMFRPDTRAFTEVYAGPRYASQAACDRAREQQVAANQKVAGFFRDVKKEERYQPDRFGTCHCDGTEEQSSATYLTPAQRTVQLRTAEDIRLRVRERLLDEKIAPDSELVRALYSDPPSTPSLGAPKLVPMLPVVPAPLVTVADDLKATRTLDAAKPTVVAMDLPIVDIGAPAASGAPASPAAEAAAPALSGAPPPSAPPAAEPPVEETRVEETPAVEQADEEEAPSEEEQTSIEQTAERFISYETQRIQNVLRASSAIADENVKTRIFEACMERIQLLSNLRLLIEGSGTRSRLAVAARDAQTEVQRLTLVARLFGDSVKPHWAPSDASDVVFEIEPSVAAEPERALRDSTGRFTNDQKKHALYLVLAQTQPTEDQRLWLSTVVEGFLR